MASQVFYAVAKGKKPGIYTNKDDFVKNTKGVSGAVAVKCKTLQEAEKFMKSNGAAAAVKEVHAALPAQGPMEMAASALAVALAKPKAPVVVNLGDGTEINHQRVFFPQKVIVYTDGSTAYRQPENHGFGVLFLKANREPVYEFAGHYYGEEATSARMELVAVLEALRLLTDGKKHDVMLYTDNQGIVDLFMQPKEGTVREKILECADGDVAQKIYELMQAPLLQVKFVKVKAHEGNTSNEEVDRLARLGAITYQRAAGVEEADADYGKIDLLALPLELIGTLKQLEAAKRGGGSAALPAIRQEAFMAIQKAYESNAITLANVWYLRRTYLGYEEPWQAGESFTHTIQLDPETYALLRQQAGKWACSENLVLKMALESMK